MNDIKTDQLSTTTPITQEIIEEEEENNKIQIPKIVIQPQATTTTTSKKRVASISDTDSLIQNGNEAKYPRHDSTTATSDTYTYQDLDQELRAAAQAQQQQQSQNVIVANMVQNLQPIQNHSMINSNADEIYQLLSQRIAKYCQVLADLTNCEVFFKSTLNQRSLYWGTYKMMFNYTHQGLQYDRNEALIKISSRSLSADVNNIVEELLGAEQLNDSYYLDTSQTNADNANDNVTLNLLNDTTATTTAGTSINGDISSYVNEITTNLDTIEFKDCGVYVQKLDDNLLEEYLSKFEKSRVYVEEEPILLEMNKANEQQQQQHQQQQQQDELFPSNDELFMCDQCADHSYKHLPQLKLHILKEHEKVSGLEEQSQGPFTCPKCTTQIDQDQNDYLNHLLLCYYPDLYTCKICTQSFSNYSEFLIHTKYIHTQVFVCSICNRKFKNVKDLLDHDQLMHSKTLNYCEICYEPMKSRLDVQNHYKQQHMGPNINKTSNQNEQQQSAKIRKTIDSRLSQDSSSIQSGFNQSSIGEFKTIDFSNALNEATTTTGTSNVTQTATNDLKSSTLAKVQKNDLIRGLLDRKHQCKWCTQRFYTKSQLKQHESTHVNATLFCPVCDKEFTHKDRLAGHMKCHMEPSLECKVCGKKFKRLCNLYNHELVHGLTEHAFMLCQFCGRGFRSRRDYQNHVIANHRDQLMKSEIIMKNGANNVATAAAVLVQNTVTISNQLAAADSPKQMTPINTNTPTTTRRSNLQKQQQQSTNNKSDSLTYFTHLTHGSNSTTVASFGDDDEVMNEEQQQQQVDENEQQLDDEEIVQETKRTRQQIQKNRKANGNNNTQLLVEAAEFVNNQSN